MHSISPVLLLAFGSPSSTQCLDFRTTLSLEVTLLLPLSPLFYTLPFLYQEVGWMRRSRPSIRNELFFNGSPLSHTSCTVHPTPPQSKDFAFPEGGGSLLLFVHTFFYPSFASRGSGTRGGSSYQLPGPPPLPNDLTL